ncbi:site-specific DNA-methyltransferase [Ruminococcaceae bacterium OttesenSCG-928-O06]|nr:site-specific DNA-methyltransferase [Ruminococcaceae bacterium OttesenSCG-928-O06]
MNKRNKAYLPEEPPWVKLYSMNLPSTRGGLFYNTFAYPTKISPEAIAVYIASHTKPGDTVLDTFGGSGSTGIAALMCEHPTESMKALAEKYDIQPEWGARNAIVYELGKYGAFASQVMANPPDQKLFTEAVNKLLKATEGELPLYNTKDAAGNQGVIRHIVYSDMVLCPRCDKEFTYYAGMVRYAPLRVDGDGICPHCGHKSKASDFPYVTEEVYDDLLKGSITLRKRVPARVYGQTGREKWVRAANEEDVAQFKTTEALSFPREYRAQEIVWGELHRAGYHTGISHLHHFYTKRNFLIMYSLWKKAGAFDPQLRDAIRLLLLSYNASHATLMTRVVVKKNSKDFVLTSAQSGVLYVSSLPVEKNILTGIKRKLKSFEDAFIYLNRCSGHIDVINKSSQHLAQPDKSVDYVFADPPFGDFIPYAEVNQINELWLGETTNRTDEIIISQSQKKDVSRYQKMMTDVFCEIKRVLKDNAYATIVFHASKAAIWNALCAAYSDAGLSVTATSSLDKQQASFKQVVSEGSVQGDPLILLSKGVGVHSSVHSQTILDEVIKDDNSDTTKNERRIYANYIGKCLNLGITVDFDAKTAYDYIARKMEAVE